MQLRDYQQEAVTRTLLSLRQDGNNPLVVLPTGAGKSVVIGALVKELLEAGDKILVLAHRKELILQNATAIRKVHPEVDLCFYSNSVGEKELHADVIVAGIASIARLSTEKLPEIRYILIDEAHLVSNADTGQYRSLISKLSESRPVSVIGFSATPFRLKGGYLHTAKDRIFTEIAHEVPITTLMAKGYLAPLVNKSSVVRLDLSKLSTHAGEFVQSEYDALFNTNNIIEETVRDILSYAEGRKSWLLFCTSIDHAHNVCRALWKHSINAVTIDSNTPQEDRDLYLQHFKEGKIQAICNCDVLTVGFDAPNVDLVILLRPTKSPGLYIQMVGRGLRLSPGKKNCLVLDYGQNIERFGPLDKLRIRQSFTKAEAETIPLKVCPDCREVIDSSEKICPSCGKVFPVAERKRTTHSSRASNLDILRGSLMKAKFDGEQILQVVKHNAVLHYKPNKPPSVRIDYYLNMLDKVSEWVCPEHTGFAKQKAEEWWKIHADNDNIPETAEEFKNAVQQLDLAQKIVVKLENDYPRIITRFYKNGPLGGVSFE